MFTSAKWGDREGVPRVPAHCLPPVTVIVVCCVHKVHVFRMFSFCLESLDWGAGDGCVSWMPEAGEEVGLWVGARTVLV